MATSLQQKLVFGFPDDASRRAFHREEARTVRASTCDHNSSGDTGFPAPDLLREVITFGFPDDATRAFHREEAGKERASMFDHSFVDAGFPAPDLVRDGSCQICRS